MFYSFWFCYPHSNIFTNPQRFLVDLFTESFQSFTQGSEWHWPQICSFLLVIVSFDNSCWWQVLKPTVDFPIWKCEVSRMNKHVCAFRLDSFGQKHRSSGWTSSQHLLELHHASFISCQSCWIEWMSFNLHLTSRWKNLCHFNDLISSIVFFPLSSHVYFHVLKAFGYKLHKYTLTWTQACVFSSAAPSHRRSPFWIHILCYYTCSRYYLGKKHKWTWQRGFGKPLTFNPGAVKYELQSALSPTGRDV